MKKILVTGACGFIGSHLVEELVKNNFKVKALVYYNSRNSIGLLENLDKSILKNIEIIFGDIKDGEFLIKNSKNIDVIINLAALIGIPYSYHAPKSYIDTNIYGSYNVLNAARSNNIDHTIIISTSEVYGTAQEIPIKETHPLNAQSPYAASKIGADQLALSFNKSFGLPVSILRPFNTFGPRQSQRAIIPTIINQLVVNKNRILKLGNLSPTRDFTYVKDTVKAFTQAIKNKNKIVGQVFNIGNNFEISIKDILKIFKEDFGYDFTVKIDKQRVRKKGTEVERLYASSSKLKKIINWSPDYSGKSGFKKGLSETINWFKKNDISLNHRLNNYNI
jgi:NAD dependent epimerase/dehydratase